MQLEKFKLHEQLESDTFPVISLALSDVLLTNDSRYLWCIVVPRLAGLRDFHDIPAQHKRAMHDELDRVSIAVKAATGAYKINVAALGNMVEQLHVHVIARHQSDAAWPGPIWGVGESTPYTVETADMLITDLRDSLS